MFAFYTTIPFVLIAQSCILGLENKLAEIGNSPIAQKNKGLRDNYAFFDKCFVIEKLYQHFLSRFPDLTTGVLTCNWGDTGLFP